MKGIIVIFVLNDKKLSSHIDNISKHINSSNHKIHYHDQMRKMIFNLSIKECENKNNNSTCQINNRQNILLMSSVEIPQNNVSNVDRKLDKRKMRNYSINSSSTLFYCSISSIYNRVHCA